MNKKDLFRHINEFIKPAAKLKSSDWEIKTGNKKYSPISPGRLLVVNNSQRIEIHVAGFYHWHFNLRSSRLILEFLTSLLISDEAGVNFLNKNAVKTKTSDFDYSIKTLEEKLQLFKNE